MYVDDNTNSGTCASDPKIECFFQVLAVYTSNNNENRVRTSLSFSENSASISGNILYGGLLDRCAVSPFAEYDKQASYDKVGIDYLKKVSNIAIDNNIIKNVSSEPVRVCHCTNNTTYNCMASQSPNIIMTRKGDAFKVLLVAVDQLDQPVNATIQTSLKFADSELLEGQLNEIPAECTELTFNVVSQDQSETLSLYASDGPCKNAELSTAKIEINFLPCSCPIGLQVSDSETNCLCECHSNISQYVEQCDSISGSLVKIPQSRVWIDYINDTEDYLLYPNCPFDYCLSNSSDYKVNFNEPNGSGADAQCAFSRSSRLCGSCQSSHSLSLGSSHCLQCSDYWPAVFIAITIAAILAGIALVALLLVLNMTVAVGTLNGLIFYANVVYANKSILLPFQETNFLTVFISWLNLELGIDTCYFPGMDTYIKTWLQLAFPAYVILLVILVIIISSYSTEFSNLIGKKNPVATLATLILLSYAKFLEVCFKSLTVGILEYPNDRNVSLWLPDATLEYLSGKHIPLFLTAVLILLIGLVYTVLLFSWQWLLYLPKWRIFKWSRNPKIQTFIETYHTPYTPKHRYWTGLLLIVRIILYLVAAANVSNDPTVALTAIVFTVCCILALRLFFGSRLYRKWPVDVLETFFYLNMLSFATFIWYSLDKSDNKHAEQAAYTSVIIGFLVLLLIILYHVYTYTSLFSKVKKTKLGRMINRFFTDGTNHQKLKPKLCLPPDNDIHRFDEILCELDCPVNTDDYNSAPLRRPSPVQPTCSVVDVHHPCLAPPDPEGPNVENVLPDSQQLETTAINN